MGGIGAKLHVRVQLSKKIFQTAECVFGVEQFYCCPCKKYDKNTTAATSLSPSISALKIVHALKTKKIPHVQRLEIA